MPFSDAQRGEPVGWTLVYHHESQVKRKMSQYFFSLLPFKKPRQFVRSDATIEAAIRAVYDRGGLGEARGEMSHGF